MKDQLLKQIPSVDKLLSDLQNFHSSRSFLAQEIRRYLSNLRQKILHGIEAPEIEGDSISYTILLSELKDTLKRNFLPKICRALNATGVILHTGLGRAVLPEKALQTLCRELSGYCVLEIDRKTGTRTIRDSAVKDLLCSLTGAENSTVVNNNAGAVLLMLSALCRGREVIVSRGQLVEIGGSFRMPDVMAESGAKLVEVGCTNRTHLSDYEKAITSNTIAILHVHTSNYRIYGFTFEVALEELAHLATQRGILLLKDAGSGAILDFSPWNLRGDPIIRDCIKVGADIVTFSGDKLLGGCQAGIIVGKNALIEKIQKHPLARVLRVDKLTLSVLESTLMLYQEGNYLEDIPALNMLTAKPEQIRLRAERIAEELRSILLNTQINVVPSKASVGSGSFPTEEIDSYAVALKSEIPSSKLVSLLRMFTPPVFVRVDEETVLMDPRTLLPQQDQEIIKIIKEVFHIHRCKLSSKDHTHSE